MRADVRVLSLLKISGLSLTASGPAFFVRVVGFPVRHCRIRKHPLNVPFQFGLVQVQGSGYAVERNLGVQRCGRHPQGLRGGPVFASLLRRHCSNCVRISSNPGLLSKGGVGFIGHSPFSGK